VQLIPTLVTAGDEGSTSNYTETVMVERLVARNSTVNMSALVWPMPSWLEKQDERQTCERGYVPSEQGGCQSCPPGQSSYTESTLCVDCSPGFYSYADGGACQKCPVGGDCSGTGTKMPTSMTGYYELPPQVVSATEVKLYFVECNPPSVCLGQNTCHHAHEGALCQQCRFGNARNLVTRTKDDTCQECPSSSSMVMFGLLFIVSMAEIGRRCTQRDSFSALFIKRVIAYCQLCAVATQSTDLRTRDPMLSVLADIMLNPWQTVLAQECLMPGLDFAQTGFRENVNLAFAALIHPSCVFLTMIAIGIREVLKARGKEVTPSRRESGAAQATRILCKLARQLIFWVYFLYLPVLTILLGNLRYVYLDEARLATNLRILYRNYYTTASLSGCVFLMYGLAMPAALFFLLFKMRKMLSEKTLKAAFGYTYCEFESDKWYADTIIFLLSFLFQLGTLLLEQRIKLCFMLAVLFAWYIWLANHAPYLTLDDNVLPQLAKGAITSSAVILAQEFFFHHVGWNGTEGLQWIAQATIWMLHFIFALRVAKSYFKTFVLDHLLLTEKAMPGTMNIVEQKLVDVCRPKWVTWMGQQQRLDITMLSEKDCSAVLDLVLNCGKMCAGAKDRFHASFMVAAMNEAMKASIEQRREQLIELHPHIYKRQEKPGVPGFLLFWFPWLTRVIEMLESQGKPASVPEQGILQARQKAARSRSRIAALRRVSSSEVTLDELRESLLNVGIMIQSGQDILKEVPVPDELIPGDELMAHPESQIGSQSRKGQGRAKQRASSGDGSMGDAEGFDMLDEKLAAKGSMSAELLSSRIAELAAQAESLRKERDNLREQLEHLAESRGERTVVMEPVMESI